jgi:4-amino-4-deoxy-L-arabinose transferase-like glycosyltransferase
MTTAPATLGTSIGSNAFTASAVGLFAYFIYTKYGVPIPDAQILQITVLLGGVVHWLWLVGRGRANPAPGDSPSPSS